MPAKESGPKRLLGWIGVVTRAIGLITGLSEVVGPLKGWWKQEHQSHAMLATAQQQSELAEYSAAMDTLAEILKTVPAISKRYIHAWMSQCCGWKRSAHRGTT